MSFITYKVTEKRAYTQIVNMELCFTLSAALLSVLVTQVTTIPLEDFYEFGSDHSDQMLSPNDDGSSQLISLGVSFPFFGTDRNSLYVSIKTMFNLVVSIHVNNDAITFHFICSSSVH